MRDTYVVAIEGLSEQASLDQVPAHIIRAARQAVNKTTERTRAAVSRETYRQVKFPSGYLLGSKGRLYIKKLATDSDLEAIIAGRSRPTSLSRFVTGSLAVGGAKRKAGLRVEVKPGSARRMPGAFLIKLRAGSSTETKNNLGVAVRTKSGRPPPGYKPVKLAQNLWLLYGPSVSSVLYSARNQGGVATDIQQPMTDFLEAEFIRLLDLKQ